VWKCTGTKYKPGTPSPLFALEMLHRQAPAADTVQESGLNSYGDVKGGGVVGFPRILSTKKTVTHAEIYEKVGRI
jgi:hypothetical protein